MANEYTNLTAANREIRRLRQHVTAQAAAIRVYRPLAEAYLQSRTADLESMDNQEEPDDDPN
jgi:hypothetical protein